MLLGSKGGTQGYYTLLQSSRAEGDLCSLLQDLPDLLRIIGRKYDLILSQGALDPWIKKFCELEVIGYADEAHPGAEKI